MIMILHHDCTRSLAAAAPVCVQPQRCVQRSCREMKRSGAQMINALKKGENALLEAPTGSGKTLSLLCAALAWHDKRKADIREQAAARMAAGIKDWEEDPTPTPPRFVALSYTSLSVRFVCYTH